MICRVAVVSGGWGWDGGGWVGGWGGGCGGGGEDVTVVTKGLRAHEHTCQCTQVDAWPMLVADAGKKRLESHQCPTQQT